MSLTVHPLSTIASLNGAFSPDHPGLQLVWDSTSYREFQSCPWKYYLTIIQGIAPRNRNINLTFGIAWHSALERYHKLRAAGQDHDDALLSTVAETYYRQLRTPKEWTYSFWGEHEESIPQYSSGGSGRTDVKSPRTLVRALIAYLDRFGANDDLHTVILPSGAAAVEYSFTVPIPNTPFSWAGHLDRLVASAPLDFSAPALPEPLPHIYNTDYKTTTAQLNDYYFQQYSPDIQMSGYDLGSRVVLPFPASGVYIDAVQLLKTGQEFVRHKVPRSSSQLEEFLTGFLSDTKEATRYAEEENWPMRFTSCRGPYGDCIFRSICSAPPAVRPQLLNASFTQRIWDPTRAR